MDLRSLKSGSDIRGTAVAAGKDSVVNLTPDAVSALAYAFAVFLDERRTNKSEAIKVAVGHDSRISAADLLEAVINGLKYKGVHIHLCGLTSTPAMFFMCRDESVKCDGAIMLTASHHPYDKNGMKFFTQSGGLESTDIDRLIETGSKFKRSDFLAAKYKVKKSDFNKLYCDSLIKLITERLGNDAPLEGLKVVVDAGNGSGGFYADRVLAPLGADVTGSQFLEPDGLFPNHPPNPESTVAMRSVSARVTSTNADFGIIFDTDVDRAAVVDEYGDEYNRNRLIALISAILLEETPGATIVTDSITSDALTDFITRAGGKHHRFKRGYRNVINEAIRLNDKGIFTPLAIETSGHAAMRENYFLDDGAYLATRLLIKLAELKAQGKTLGSLIESLDEPVETGEYRIPINGTRWRSYAKKILRKTKKFVRRRFRLVKKNKEGVRGSFDGGWFLVRLSVHDPVIALNIESAHSGGVKDTLRKLDAFLSRFKKLNLSGIKIDLS